MGDNLFAFGIVGICPMQTLSSYPIANRQCQNSKAKAKQQKQTTTVTSKNSNAKTEIPSSTAKHFDN